MLTVNSTTYVWNNDGLQAALKASPNGAGVEIVSDMRAAPLEVRVAILKQAKAEGFDEGMRQAGQDARTAALAERARINEISALTPRGCEDQAQKAIAEGLSPDQFAYKLTLAAIAGGKPLPMPHSSRKH